MDGLMGNNHPQDITLYQKLFYFNSSLDTKTVKANFKIFKGMNDIVAFRSSLY